MFPTINHLNDLLPYIQDNPQIRVKVEPNGMTVVCYMLQDEDTFSGANADFAAECRGITFHQNGKIAARTLHKFFNVGQEDSTRPENIDWTKVVRIMDKRDGSMITPVLVGGLVKCKTKKSFDTKEAALADSLVRADPAKLQWVNDLLLCGYTPTFEVTSPSLPIVLLYDKDELTLLHIRSNRTGRYLDEDEVKAFKPPFPMVENVMQRFVDEATGLVDWALLKEAAEVATGVEGWVIQFENGDMVKLKTQWYCDLHHSVTFTRWRDIARSVVADQSDDLKGAFAMTGRSIEPILTVERGIKGKIETAKMAVKEIVLLGVVTEKDVKAMAMEYKSHPMFGQIMRAFRGQEINWMEWYEKFHLDTDWSLLVVGDEA
jgi:T4 RnlA family RNA ligase